MNRPHMLLVSSRKSDFDACHSHSTPSLATQVIKELGCRGYARDDQVISRAVIAATETRVRCSRGSHLFLLRSSEQSILATKRFGPGIRIDVGSSKC